MFGIAALVVALLNYLLIGLSAHTNTWFSPAALLSLSFALLAAHLIGASSWVRRP